MFCCDFIRKYKQKILLQNKNIPQISCYLISTLTIRAEDTEQP